MVVTVVTENTGYHQIVLFPNPLQKRLFLVLSLDNTFFVKLVLCCLIRLITIFNRLNRARVVDTSHGNHHLCGIFGNYCIIVITELPYYGNYRKYR